MGKARENHLHSELTGKLKKAFAYTTVGKKISGFGLKSFGNNLMEKGLFNTWMYEEQDKIQAFAKSYADRLVAEAFMETISENSGKGDEYKDAPIATNASADLEPMLKKLMQLHNLSRIEDDLSFFLVNGVIDEECGNQIIECNRKLCAELAPHALNLVDSFDLPEEVLAAPIATDWVKFNEVDNQGELGSKDDFMKHLKEFSS